MWKWTCLLTLPDVFSPSVVIFIHGGVIGRWKCIKVSPEQFISMPCCRLSAWIRDGDRIVSLAAILQGTILSSQFQLHCRYLGIYSTHVLGSYLYVVEHWSIKTPLQKCVCVQCMFWKHIFMRWSKESLVISLDLRLPVYCLLSQLGLSERKYDVYLPWHLPWVDFTDLRDIQVGLHGFFHTWGHRLGSYYAKISL